MEAGSWQGALDQLRAAVGPRSLDCLALHSAIANLPPIEAEANPDTLREELAGLLGEAADWLLAMDRDMAGLLELVHKPWDAILRLAAAAGLLSHACQTLLQHAQLDSKAQFKLLSAALAGLTGSMLRAQQQLASSAAQGRAGGSPCTVRALLPCLPLLGAGAPRLRQVLVTSPATLPDVYGCIVLQQVSAALALAILPGRKAAALPSAHHGSAAADAAGSSPHHSAAAALARTAAKPAVMLPLLAQLLPCVQRLRQADRDDVGATWPMAVPTTVTALLDSPEFSCQFEAALRQDVALLEQLFGTCLTALECALQRLDANTASGSEGGGRGLGSPAALSQHGGGQRGAAAATTAAGQPAPWEDLGCALSVLSMPPLTDVLDVVAAGPRSAQLFECAAAAIKRLVSRAAEQHFGARPARVAIACQALPVAGSAHSAQIVLAKSGAADMQALAWKATSLLPAAIAAVRLAAADSDSQDPELLPMAVLSLSTLADPQPLRLAQGLVRSAADVAAWCAAATAALRVLPLLLQLQPQLCASAMVRMTDAAEVVEGLPPLLLAFVNAPVVQVNEFNVRLTSASEGQAEAVEAQAEPLFLLHSTAVRFVHWLCSLDEGQLAATPGLRNWDAWHTMVHVIFTEAVGVHRMGRTQADIAGDTEQEALFTRRLHSLCLAHAPLVPIISAKTGRAFDNPNLGFFTELLFLTAYTPIAALDLQLAAAFERSVRSSLQAPPPHGLVEKVWDGVHKWLVEAEEQPQYFVFLLTSGLAQEGLAAAEAAAVANDMPLPSVARRLLATAHVCCFNLGATTGNLLSAMSDPSTVDRAASPHAAAISAAHAELSTALRPLLTRFPPPPSLELLQRYRAVVTTAAALATALQAYWHSPEQLQAGRLAAARAAAARSCAYLRCANLGGEGGTRAGTGAGSSRCSACRVVWYCGTACSHADWRAGHKRMCKLLGEARLAEKGAAAEL